MTVQRANRIAAASIAVGSLACVIAAALMYAPAMTLGPAWKPVTARVVRSDLEKSHDAVGRLQFQVRSVLQYDAEGSPRVGTALSPVTTHDFALCIQNLRKFSSGSLHTVYYKAGSPDQLRFGSELLWLHGRKPAAMLGAALVLAVIALFIGLKRQPRDCVNCGERIKSYYTYCPKCATPVDTPPVRHEDEIVINKEQEGIAESSV